MYYTDKNLYLDSRHTKYLCLIKILERIVLQTSLEPILITDLSTQINRSICRIKGKFGVFEAHKERKQKKLWIRQANLCDGRNSIF